MLDIPFDYDDVQEFRTIVQVEGITRDHLSWSRGKDASLGLPSPILEYSGSTVTRCKITFPPIGQDVTYRLLTPWSTDGAEWPPTPGQKVTIDVLYEGGGAIQTARRFTGYIDSVSGGLNVPLVLSCADEAHLTSTLTLHPSAVSMPGVGVERPYNETSYYTSQAPILPFYAAQAALTRAGFGFYPRESMEDAGTEEVLLRWDLQGSVMPTIGDFVKNDEGLEWHEEDGILFPDRWVWGQFPRQQQAITMRCVHRSGVEFRIADDLNYGVWVQIYGPTVYIRDSFDGTQYREYTLPYAPAKWGWVTVNITPQADPTQAGNHFRLELFNGAQKQLDEIITHNYEHRPYIVGGVRRSPAYQVSASGLYDRTAEGWDKTPYRIHYTPSEASTGMDATRTHATVQTADLLKEVAKATCTGVWMDDFGIWQWKPLDKLLNAPLAVELDTTHHVLDLEWDFALDSRRSLIQVNYHDVSITLADGPQLKLWAPSNTEEAVKNSSIVMVMEPPEYGEWLSPDLTFQQVGWVGHANNNTPAQVDFVDEYNTGVGSFWGIVGSFNDGEHLAWLYYDLPTFSVKMFNPRKIVARHNLQGRRIPADGVRPSQPGEPAPRKEDGKYFLSTATTNLQPEVNNLKKIRMNDRLPILRGPGYTRFNSRHVRSNSGIYDGSQYTHYMSEWGREQDARAILDILTPLMVKGLPTISEIPVRYDPRYTLGDKITITAERLLGMKLTCLIRSLSEGQEVDGKHYVTLGLVVVESERIGGTYSQDQENQQDKNYEQDQLNRTQENYSTVTSED